jgi:hypothetical protein
LWIDGTGVCFWKEVPKQGKFDELRCDDMRM